MITEKIKKKDTTYFWFNNEKVIKKVKCGKISNIDTSYSH